MALENADYISQLVPTNPPGTDQAATSDDHHRVIKRAVQQSFPNINGPVNATPAQLNGLTGLGNSLVAITSASGILTTNASYTAAQLAYLTKIANTLTASRAAYVDSGGVLASHATVSDTELGYLDGVTSAIQTQIDGKSAVAHDHTGGSESAIDTASLAAGAVTQAKLQTDTMGWTGFLAADSFLNFAVSGYAFFPMVHGGGSNIGVMVAHSTDGLSADAPRFGLWNNDYNTYGDSVAYDVDWRYIDA